jgi:hypothetical protein
MQEAKIKSYKYNDVMKKLKDGSWETKFDVVARRHLEVIDNETKKKMTIFVEGKLQEANYSVTYLTSGGKGTQGVKRVVRVTKTFISREKMMKWIDSTENGEIEGFIDIISISENTDLEESDDKLKELIKKFNDTGRVAVHYPKKKRISVNGISYAEDAAIEKMKKILQAQGIKESFRPGHGMVPAPINDKTYKAKGLRKLWGIEMRAGKWADTFVGLFDDGQFAIITPDGVNKYSSVDAFERGFKKFRKSGNLDESSHTLTSEEIIMINESLDSADKREYGSQLVRIKLRLKRIVAEIEDAGGFETDGNIFKVLDSRAKKLVSEYETLKAEEQRILDILHKK